MPVQRGGHEEPQTRLIKADGPLSVFLFHGLLRYDFSTIQAETRSHSFHGDHPGPEGSNVLKQQCECSEISPRCAVELSVS